MDLGTFFNYPDGEGGDPAVQPAATASNEAPFLGTCSEDEWALIRSHAERLRFPPDAVVIQSGSVDRALVIISAGVVDIIDRRRRRARTVATMTVGACLGEISFLDGLPATAEARARTEVDALRLSVERFEVLAAKEPAFATFVLFDLGRVLATRVRNAEVLLQR